MNIKDIPFLIANFNQLTYLRNLINQIRWYYPENPIVVIDNGSDYAPLLRYYAENTDSLSSEKTTFEFEIERYVNNDFVSNLRHYLDKAQPEYYVITDPDLSIPPTTPPFFLEVFKAAIDNHGFHHAGFGLKTDDLPAWNPKSGWIRGDELALLKSPVTITHEGVEYQGYRAPIDTCMALYKRDNSGWAAPMEPKHWDNSVRIFECLHLPWYIHPDFVNAEMRHYYATCKRRDDSLPSAGRSHHIPQGL